jgi:anti-sigma B factor antagonist
LLTLALVGRDRGGLRAKVPLKCYISFKPLRSVGVSLQFNTTRVEPGIVVVQLTGSILLWPEGQIGVINELLENNERKLILDLSGIEHMDSSGAELMFECFNAAKKAGGALRFAAPKPRVARLFQVTRLDTILPFFPTVAAACESFTNHPKAEGEAG